MSYFLTYMIGRRLHVSSVSICLLVEGQTPQLYGRLQPKVRLLESNSMSILSCKETCLPLGELVFVFGFGKFFGLCPF